MCVVVRSVLTNLTVTMDTALVNQVTINIYRAFRANVPNNFSAKFCNHPIFLLYLIGNYILITTNCSGPPGKAPFQLLKFRFQFSMKSSFEAHFNRFH